MCTAALWRHATLTGNWRPPQRSTLELNEFSARARLRLGVFVSLCAWQERGTCERACERAWSGGMGTYMSMISLVMCQSTFVLHQNLRTHGRFCPSPPPAHPIVH